MTLVARVLGLVLYAYHVIAAFLGPAVGSIKGHINVQEMARVAIVAFMSGGGAGGVVSAISGDLPAIVSNPADMAVATAAAALISETIRRLGHGTTTSTASAKK